MGTLGTACGKIDWNENIVRQVLKAMEAHRRTSRDPRLKEYFMMGELELKRRGVNEMLVGIPLYDSHNCMIERDVDSVPVDDRRNICIGWVTPQGVDKQKQQASHLGFEDVRAGFAVKGLGQVRVVC